jgi:dihydroflavonol-4-reductase
VAPESEPLNLIVGGTGFIGGHLAEYFLQQGEISKGTFRKGSHLYILDQSGVQCLEADLLQRESLHEPLDMVNVVYNLASPTPRNGGGEYLRVNTEGLRNLLEEAREHGVKRFVHLSTLDVCGFGRSRELDLETKASPTHPYQVAKFEAEVLIKEFAKHNSEIQVSIVRAARAIGPRDPTFVVPILRMVQTGTVTLPQGAQATMSFSHPKDIAQALLRVGQGTAGDLLLVKSFDASTEEVARALVNSCGASAAIKQQGILGKTLFPSYTCEQIKAGLTVKTQSSWGTIGYVPAYSVSKVADEVAAWYGKNPWATEEGQT